MHSDHMASGGKMNGKKGGRKGGKGRRGKNCVKRNKGRKENEGRGRERK